LWICKIGICFLLVFQFRSKLRKNRCISLCSKGDTVGLGRGSKNPFEYTGEEDELKKKKQKQRIKTKQESNKQPITITITYNF